MSRSIADLLPDIRLSAAGVPQPLALQLLTRSLSEFLDRSEAWREWLPVKTVANIAAGVTGWTNHLGDTTHRWSRIKRVDKMQWHPTGNEITFKTAQQLQDTDPEWRTREGAKPFYFTNEGEVAATDEDHVSGFQVRLYPIPEATVDATYGVRARVVIVTDVVADMGLNDFDSQIPSIPDRIFYSHREAIVAGALAKLLLMPGKDWSSPALAAVHQGNFERAVIRAESRGNAEFGHPTFTTGYGGI